MTHCLFLLCFDCIFYCFTQTDYSVNIGNKRIGVSVTRAMENKNKKKEFSSNDGYRLLCKKLYSINESNKYVCKSNRWHRQILHIIASSDKIRDIIYNEWQNLLYNNKLLCNNTIVLITVAQEVTWLFFQPRKKNWKTRKKDEMKINICKLMIENDNNINGDCDGICKKAKTKGIDWNALRRKRKKQRKKRKKKLRNENLDVFGCRVN